MKKIVLILPYFGKFKNYFELFLYSAARNISIDFLIYTDQQINIDADNIKIIPMQFNEIQNRLQGLFDFQIQLEKPYKLCEFKPCYGELFAEDIKDYDFWGYCDCDLIFGDIRKFVTEDILNRYDKIGTRGHFTLYRNNPENNSLYRKVEYPSIQEVFTNSYAYGFDEWHGVSKYWEDHGLKQYDPMEFDDIRRGFDGFHPNKEVPAFLPTSAYHKGYVSQAKEFRRMKKIIYHYQNGKLIRCCFVKGKYQESETYYAHFQKRDMQVQFTDQSNDDYYIINDCFVDSEHFSTQMHVDVKSDTLKNKKIRFKNFIYSYYFLVSRAIRKYKKVAKKS